MPRDTLRIFRLVVAVFLKADRERMHRPRAHALHHGDDGARIYSAGKKRAERNVGLHSLLHGALKPNRERFYSFFERSRKAPLGGAEHDLLYRPVFLRDRVAASFYDLQICCRRQFRDIFVNGVRGGNVPVPQIQRKDVDIEFRTKLGVLKKALQLRAEKKRAAHPTVIERFLSETVAAKEQRSLGAVPDGHSEHAVQLAQRRLDTPRVKPKQHDFGIGASAQLGRKVSSQLGTKLVVIVDFAVEDDDESAARGNHGLVTGGRDVDD